MSRHILKTSLTIDRPRGEVFAFFSDAGNLEAITPPELKFNIVTPRPIDLKKGALIDYELRLRGLPLKWRTEICVWDPPNVFVDRQLSGPYREWVHRHVFTDTADGGTLIEDEVQYQLPLAPLGDIVHFLVRRELDRIFAFRQRTVAAMLSKEGDGSGG